jgi:hypothetical protein
MNRDPRSNGQGYEPPMWAVVAVFVVLIGISLRVPAGGGQIPTPFDPDPSGGSVPVWVIAAATLGFLAVIVLLVFSRRGNGGEGGGGWGGRGPDDDGPAGPWTPPPSDYRPERAPAAPVPVRSAVRPLDTGDLFAQWAKYPAPVEPAPVAQPAGSGHVSREASRRRGLYDGGAR